MRFNFWFETYLIVVVNYSICLIFLPSRDLIFPYVSHPEVVAVNDPFMDLEYMVYQNIRCGLHLESSFVIKTHLELTIGETKSLDVDKQ